VKVEFHLDGPNAMKWFAGALLAYNEAIEADRAYWDSRYTAEFGNGPPTQATDCLLYTSDAADDM
jgi:hypothetical protein